MKHLVITVSRDSSIELLKEFADVIILDKEAIPNSLPSYESLYIRSHFGKDETLPQVFRKEIEAIVELAKAKNPNIKFVDDTDSIEKILSAEDKWLQYETFGDVMPRTILFDDRQIGPDFQHPVFKNRFSSRGNGVTWEMKDVTDPTLSWIVQESLDIREELRIYIIRGEVYPLGTLRKSKTQDQHTEAIDSRALSQDEVTFSQQVAKRAPAMDILGLDIARTTEGKLYLMEANRSPGFGKFYALTGVNLASALYNEEQQA